MADRNQPFIQCTAVKESDSAGFFMEVSLAVLADFASASDGKLNILGIFQDLNPDELPMVVPLFYLVISLVAYNVEEATKRKLQLDLMDTQGARALALGAEVEFPVAKKRGRPSYVNSTVGLAGLSFSQVGEYVFRIIVDGTQVGAISLYVNEPTSSDHVE